MARSHIAGHGERSAAGTLGVFLVAAALLACLAPAPASAQEVLIVRKLDKIGASTPSAEVVLEFEITAFSNLVEVRVNGEVQTIPRSNWVTVRKSIRLQAGTNRIVVEARTAQDAATKEFVIERRPEGVAAVRDAAEQGTGTGATPAGPQSDVFTFVGAGGLQYSTNPLSQRTNEKAGMRMFLIAIPTYEMPLEESNALRTQLIASRDKYDDKKLEGLEIAFTQASAAFVMRGTPGEVTTLGLGLNKIDVVFDTPLAGKTTVENDVFVFGGWRQTTEGDVVELSGEIKSMDLKSPAGDTNADATELTLQGLMEGKLGPFRSRYRASLTQHDAVGKYEDRMIIRLSGDLNSTAAALFGSGGDSDKIALGAGARIRRETFATKDPAAGKAPENMFTRLVANAAVPLTPSWMLVGELALESQSSNVKALSYENTALTAMAIYAF